MNKQYEGHPYDGEPVNRQEGETAAFVVSLVSLFLLGPFGLIGSIIALVLTHRARKRGQDSSMLTASLVMGIIGCVLSALIVLFLMYLLVVAITIHTIAM